MLVLAGDSARRNGLLDRVCASLSHSCPAVRVAPDPVGPEPNLDACRRAIASATNVDVIVGLGGGSVLDVAKAAALAPFGVDPGAYLSGLEKVPDAGGIPVVAVPTTAGTGSEATWVGVFTDDSGERKSSFRGGAMMPAAVVLDPMVTISCPPNVTASSGFDAWVQAMESRVARGANPFTDALSEAAAIRLGKTLPEVFRDGTNVDARAEMLLASTMAGIALNTSRLGLVHGLAHPVGVRAKAAHGLVCALLFPEVLRFNAKAIGARYAGISQALAGNSDPLALANWATETMAGMGIPTRLRDIGLTHSDLDSIAKDSLSSGSTKANPREVTQADALAVLDRAW